jgi:arginase family enzyme
MTPESTAPPVANSVPAKNDTVGRPVVADNIISKKIKILGVPLDLGQSRRGVSPGWKRVWKSWDMWWKMAATLL